MNKSILLLFSLFHCLLAAFLWVDNDVVQAKDQVTVYFDHIDNPSNKTDRIAVFFTTSSNSSLRVTSKSINESPEWKTGSGNITFTVLNMRHSFFFKYLRNTTVLAESEPVSVNTTIPMHGHLSLTDKLNQMRITWTSNTMSIPMVRYGTEPGAYKVVVRAESSTYKDTDLCGGDAQKYFIHPGYFHTAVMSNLLPDTVYYYRFGSDEGWSDEFNFTSSQVDGSKGVNILAFGDSGVSTCLTDGRKCFKSVAALTRDMLNDLNTRRYDMIMHIGDISYATGYATRWEEFMYEIEPLATRAPYMVGVGNHELVDSFGECGVPYRKRFLMPQDPKYWYSIKYPLVHIIVMSTEHAYHKGSEQYQWLQRELASVDHENRWTVFFGHKPVYASSKYPGNIVESRNLRKAIEPLLVNNSVDVALWGHMHTYERTCPVKNETCLGNYTDPKAPVHFVIGTGGANKFNEYENFTWSLTQSSIYGYLRIHVPSRASIQLQFVDSELYKVVDDVTIYRSTARNSSAVKETNGTNETVGNSTGTATSRSTSASGNNGTSGTSGTSGASTGSRTTGSTTSENAPTVTSSTDGNNGKTTNDVSGGVVEPNEDSLDNGSSTFYYNLSIVVFLLLLSL